MLTGCARVGGIVGSGYYYTSQNTPQIEGSVNYGAIKGTEKVGGIAGQHFVIAIRNNINTGAVMGLTNDNSTIGCITGVGPY